MAHVYLLTLEAHKSAPVERDYPAAESIARRVVGSAREHGDRDLEALGLTLLGRSMVRGGRAAEGMPILDEAMVAVTSTQMSPLVIGTVYCALIDACEEISELRRANEWTEALYRWSRTQNGEVPVLAKRRQLSRCFDNALSAPLGHTPGEPSVLHPSRHSATRTPRYLPCFLVAHSGSERCDDQLILGLAAALCLGHLRSHFAISSLR
jgi:hypothetical protein